MDTLVLENNDVIALTKYRLQCLEKNETGIVICDGIEYPITVWGNFKDNVYPKFEDEYNKLMVELITKQFEKRKAMK